MSVIDVFALGRHLNILTEDDNAVLQGCLDAAEAHIAGYVGELATTFPDGLPGDLTQAVLILAGHYYENREAALVGDSVATLPFGVTELIGPYRKWEF